jgi:tetratricopeptide (TPR) repeat protein
VAQAPSLLVLSLTASRIGDTAKSVASAQEAIDVYRDQQSKRLGRALVYLASAHLRAGSYEEARTAFQDAIDYSERASDDWSRALALSNLGYLSLILGDYQTAEQMSLEAVELKRELGNNIGAIESLCNAGLAALLGLRVDDARVLLNETLRVSLDLGHDTLIACSLEGIAWIAARSSEFERAARLQGAAENRMAAAGGDLDGVEKKIHDETREVIRRGLGRGYNDQLALGRSLSVEDAVGLHSRADLAHVSFAPI